MTKIHLFGAFACTMAMLASLSCVKSLELEVNVRTVAVWVAILTLYAAGAFLMFSEKLQ